MSHIEAASPKKRSTSTDFPEPTRAEGFFRYFKQYMGLSSLAVAALPIPVATLKLIPVPSGQITIYCTYTSLFCFLTSAFIFYSRHKLANLFFGRRTARLLSVAPILLTTGSLSLAVFYQGQQLYLSPGVGPLVFFVSMFLLAEAAFALMATREYLQDILGLEDRKIIDRLKYADSSLALVTFESVPDAAEVFIQREGTPYGQNAIGVTPISRRLEPGKYTAYIRRDDYDWERAFEIEPQEERTFTATLKIRISEHESTNFSVKFESEPTGAEIYFAKYSSLIDGDEFSALSGMTPTTLLLEGGPCRVSIRLRGHINWDRIISVNDQQECIRATLEKIEVAGATP